MTIVTSIEALQALYGEPGAASLRKETNVITPQYARLIAASPFLALATSGPEGLDCSPRGDAHGLLRIKDEKTLLLPDRRGNNRIDSLANIIRDPRVALMCLIPGSGTTLRINGRAVISVEPQLLQSFAVEGHAPRSVIVMHVEAIYFQCARAVIRAGLWDGKRQIAPSDLPTPGEILSAMTEGVVGGPEYDREWPERAAKSMW